MDMSYEREQSAGYLVNWAGRLFVRAIERRLAGGNAGPMPVFFALAGGGTMSQTALARWASVEQPTMANTLNRMERDGLIVRTPDPDDRRSALIALSKLGRQRATEALTSAQEVNALALSSFKPAEREAFFDMLRRVAENLEADGGADSAPPALRTGKRAR
jgi:MarR family transcriptional regulator, transcriptional regulator for hemolysin